MWQTGGLPVLDRITIVKLLTQHVRRLLGTHQWQSTLLVVGLPVTQDWFEMGCHLSSSLISLRLTAWTIYRSCRTSIPRKRRGKHKQTNNVNWADQNVTGNQDNASNTAGTTQRRDRLIYDLENALDEQNYIHQVCQLLKKLWLVIWKNQSLQIIWGYK